MEGRVKYSVSRYLNENCAFLHILTKNARFFATFWRILCVFRDTLTNFARFSRYFDEYCQYYAVFAIFWQNLRFFYSSLGWNPFFSAIFRIISRFPAMFWLKWRFFRDLFTKCVLSMIIWQNFVFFSQSYVKIHVFSDDLLTKFAVLLSVIFIWCL